jgi:hypothetical protein
LEAGIAWFKFSTEPEPTTGIATALLGLRSLQQSLTVFFALIRLTAWGSWVPMASKLTPLGFSR